jgi:hypothetical protein
MNHGKYGLLVFTVKIWSLVNNGNGNISKQQHNMCKVKGEWKILTIYSAYPRRTPFIDK